MPATKKKQVRTYFVIASILLIAAVAGCAQDDAGAAIVDGTVITNMELDSAVETMRSQYAAQGQSITDEQLSTFRMSVLDSMIRQTAMLNEANKMGIAADSAELDVEISKIRERFPSEEQYEQTLELQGYTVESLRKEVGDNLIISALIESEVLGAIEVSEDDIAGFYAENSPYFVIPDTVTASHILIEVASTATDEERNTARAKIDEILDELKAGADFAELAKSRSEGPSGPNGGSLGSFGRGQMVPPFEEAAFALEPGELSDVVETQFGYHVIYATERTIGRTQSIDEVRDDIIEFLKQSEGEDLITAYVDELVAAAVVERPGE